MEPTCKSMARFGGSKTRLVLQFHFDDNRSRGFIQSLWIRGENFSRFFQDIEEITDDRTLQSKMEHSKKFEEILLQQISRKFFEEIQRNFLKENEVLNQNFWFLTSKVIPKDSNFEHPIISLNVASQPLNVIHTVQRLLISLHTVNPQRSLKAIILNQYAEISTEICLVSVILLASLECGDQASERVWWVSQAIQREARSPESYPEAAKQTSNRL